VPKRDKLPYADDGLLRRGFTDCSGERKAPELHPERLAGDDRALLVDDWVETGARIRATAALVEAAGASVAGITAVDVPRHEPTEPLFARHDVHSLAPVD
jgi:adenine/guanine phosphoribosyltransferase-like PRPP-binding protein